MSPHTGSQIPNCIKGCVTVSDSGPQNTEGRLEKAKHWGYLQEGVSVRRLVFSLERRKKIQIERRREREDSVLQNKPKIHFHAIKPNCTIMAT